MCYLVADLEHDADEALVLFFLLGANLFYALLILILVLVPDLLPQIVINQILVELDRDRLAAHGTIDWFASRSFLAHVLDAGEAEVVTALQLGWLDHYVHADRAPSVIFQPRLDELG